MAIDSLASATNSIFQSSPSIKGTGRMDDNTGTALVPAEYKPGDNTLDAFHHELLLSQRSAYVNIISHDSTAFFSPGVTVDLDDVVLSFGFACTVHRNMALDQSIETCFADVSVMRARRWSTTWRTTKSVCRESMLICAGVCAMRSRDCTAGLRHPEHMRRRPYAFHRGAAGVATSTSNVGMTVFVPLHNDEWVRDTQTKHAFKRTLLTILHDMFAAATEYKPQATTARSKTNRIEVPEFRYAGLALTDAHMHPSQGDTAVTVNHYSALTTHNGPYDVCIGDDLGWIFNIERNNILPDGSCIPRVALTYSVLKQVMVDRMREEARRVAGVGAAVVLGATHDERDACAPKFYATPVRTQRRAPGRSGRSPPTRRVLGSSKTAPTAPTASATSTRASCSCRCGTARALPSARRSWTASATSARPSACARATGASTGSMARARRCSAPHAPPRPPPTNIHFIRQF